MFWVALLAASLAHPCEGQGTAIVVSTAQHELWLCARGSVEQSYSVALGRGGVGKTRAGDRRTPLGAYALGGARPSARFHRFIPVAYPTAEQRKRGYTGGAIGVHGPDHRFSWAGAANTLIDWTQGCIAVSSDEKIDAIAEWVRRHSGAVIRIE